MTRVSIEARNSEEPTCANCPAPDGAGIAIIVFFPGAGTVSNETITYSQDELQFVEDMKTKIQNDASKCCRKLFVVAEYDPRLKAATNASRIANMIDGLVDLEAISNFWVTRIHVHLVGFSAGGIVATQTAARMRCDVRHGHKAVPNQITFAGWDQLPNAEELAEQEARWWCGQGDQLAVEVPVHIDVVTMATPFNLGGRLSPLVSIFASIGTFFTSLVNSDLTFLWSIAENDYGGDAPACLCGYTSFVSDPRFDDSPGGGKFPDDRLDDWNTRRNSLVTPGIAHTAVPGHVLDRYPAFLNAGCQCTS